MRGRTGAPSVGVGGQTRYGWGRFGEPEDDMDGGWLKADGMEGAEPPPAPSDDAELSVLEGGAEMGVRGPRCASSLEALASMRWLVAECQRNGGTDREARSVAAVRELGEQVRDLLHEGRRIIHAGEERWPGADAEELILRATRSSWTS
jgi:hypothetical protein